MRPFKKYVNCIIAFFITPHLLHPHLFLSYSLKLTNYGVRENKIFFIYGSFIVSRYIKKGRKSQLWAKPYLCINNTHVCIKNPYCQSSVIIIFLANIIYS